MIIVEGPDGSGKSTLIATLGLIPLWMGGVRTRSPKGVTWTDPQAGTPLAKFETQIYNRVNDPVAFDRYHLSERIYGPILRDQQEMDDYSLTRINDLLHDHHVPVILCLPPFARTMQNVEQADRPRPAYQTDAFLRLAYRRFAELMPWATIVYDFTRDSIPRLT